MPRSKGQKEFRSTWFRTYFESNLNNLNKSNAEIRSAWEGAHPGETWTRDHAQTMASVKFALRKKKPAAGKKKSKSPEVQDTPVKATRSTLSAGSLENLEEAIDECLTTARAMQDRDSEMLAVVKHLRVARNQVVLIRGNQ